MEVTIRIKKNNGEIVEVIKELDSFDNNDIIESVEQQVLNIKEILLPILSASLIEHHQVGFKGEKNKEEKRQ